MVEQLVSREPALFVGVNTPAICTDLISGSLHTHCSV